MVAAAPAREASVWAALAEISDPEIPAISLVDLGVIRGVAFGPGTAGRGQPLKSIPISPRS